MEITFEELYNNLEEFILEHYGETCNEFELNCFVCQQYLALSILKDNIDLEKGKES